MDAQPVCVTIIIQLVHVDLDWFVFVQMFVVVSFRGLSFPVVVVVVVVAAP